MTLLARIRSFVPRRPALGPLAAAVVAAIVLASAWVLRLTGTLVERSQAAQTAVTGSDVELALEDDSGGVPLLDGVVLDPGESVTRCISVEARTLADPDPLVLHLEAPSSPLADHLVVRVAGGARTDDADCTDLTPLRSTAGELSAMLDELSPDGPGWTLTDPPPGITAWWYRIEVGLTERLPDALVGASIDDLTLRWSSSAAERRDSSLGARADAFVIGVTEDAATPLVLLVVGTLLFLGIHDRIDADDPKLALAPVDRRTTTFTDREAVSSVHHPTGDARDGPPPPPHRGGPGTA